jgi:hypothetical protein
MTLVERETQREKKLRIRDKFELNNSGGYERIYPLPPTATDEKAQELASTYEVLITNAKEIWGDAAAATIGRFRKLNRNNS